MPPETCFRTAPTYSYAWDPEGHLLYVSGATPSTSFWATYGYDASGQRITATVTMSGVSVGYAYVNDAAGKEYAEINTTQAKVDYNNFWFGDRIFAKYDQANGTVFLHPNNVGSTAMTTGPTNSPIGAEVFYPWGQSWASGGTLEEERFAKLHQRDIATGLDYTLNRMYPSWQGRWLTPDLIRAGGVWSSWMIPRPGICTLTSGIARRRASMPQDWPISLYFYHCKMRSAHLGRPYRRKRRTSETT